MRNLKRALSLALATVMTLGLMVVGTGAVGYDDVADTDNVEAIEVLQAVGIMTGDENGNFNPDNLVTRNEMAVVMSQLLNLNYNYYRGTNPFTDVPSWAAPYVAACAAEGVTSGIGGGLYGGDQNVTAAQAALMILKALGYFQYQADFEGDWQVTTIRQASYINLFDGIDASAEEALTRNQIAQLVLNGLKSNMVEFTGNVGATVGDVVIGHNSQYSARTNAAQKYNKIDTGTTTILVDNGQYYVQLGEELYDGDLELDNDAIDDFGHPSRMWSYEGDEIGTYAKTELIRETYTSTVTGEDLYDLLGRSTINDYDLIVYVDGGEVAMAKSELVRSNDNSIETTTALYGHAGAITGRGVLTEVFVDPNAGEDGEITIVVTNTYLAVANSNYNSTRETVSLQVYYGDNQDTPKTVDLEDVPGIENLQEDDVVLVNWAGADATTAGKDVKIVSEVPTVLTDVEVTWFSKNVNDDIAHNGVHADRVTEIETADGDFQNNKNAWYDYATLGDYNGELLTDKTYNVYVDQYGYFIGAELYSGQDNYVFISAVDTNDTAMGNRTGKALAVFPDGTSDPIDVNVKSTNENINRVRTVGNPAYNAVVAADGNYAPWDATTNGVSRWFTYTESNGVYTLTPVTRYVVDVADAAGESITIQCDNLSLADNNSASDIGTGRAYGNDDSVYITVDLVTSSKSNNAVDEITGVFTGAQDARITYKNSTTPERGWIVAVYDSDYNIIAAVVNGDAEGAVDNYAYILSGANSEGRDSNGYYCWTFDAILNGEIQELTIRDRYDETVTALRPGVVQELIFDAEGYVRTIRDIANDDAETRPAGIQSTPVIAGGDEVFDEDDYRNGNAVTSDYSVYDLYVYGGYDKNSDNIYLDGRTLHYTSTSDQHGLGITSDAKAVLSQSVDGKRSNVEYGTVREAFAALADADDGESGKQSRVRVVAVLNSSGVAEWVFFYDYTPVGRGTDPVYEENGNVDGMRYDSANDRIRFTIGGVNAGTCTFTLWQLRDNGYVEVDSYTTDADGLSETLPIRTGETYKVTCGNFSQSFIGA